MIQATKKAGFATLIFLAAFAAAVPIVAAAAEANFSLGDITIKQEFGEDPVVPEEQPQVLATDTAEPSKTEETAKPEPVVVEVQKGDSLSKIAAAHQTTWKRLFDANKSIADPNIINPGDKIRIPSEDEDIAERPLPAAVSKPAPTRARAAAKPRATAARMVDDGSVWYRLALCESGGRPNVVSSNGLYHGLYQFLPSTWRAVGGSGLPSQASVEEQTMRAKMLQARSGWGQWPACARKLGLI